MCLRGRDGSSSAIRNFHSERKVDSFIEVQFPIARLSAEAYKERKAGASQTLTGLGKWWGRKPLVLVRASILGMLMPASDNAKKDREIFLKALMMDDDGVWLRCKPQVRKKSDPVAFSELPYADRIAECVRPEEVDSLSDDTWSAINSHLGTDAYSFEQLTYQLGVRRFNRRPRVGDAFCGGGSIPFEAAHCGCDAYASDLNPVAGLLTWASLNLTGAPSMLSVQVVRELKRAYEKTDAQIQEWGIESNQHGERAEAYLYCAEVRPEGCDYYIPMAPSWVVSDNFRAAVVWRRDGNADRLTPEVLTFSEAEFKEYKNKKGATIVNGRLIDPFNQERSWSIESLRGPEGLRLWDASDIVARSTDVFHERLYCIRWIDEEGRRRFGAPDESDLQRESHVLRLLQERFAAWQAAGFVPSKKIDKGQNLDQPVRERGWTYWHQLFTPRQLLMYGAYLENVDRASSVEVQVAQLLKLGVQANWNSKLCIWNADKSKGPGSTEQTFANQALNTLANYGTRSFGLLRESLTKDFTHINIPSVAKEVVLNDARDISYSCDMWITDPPYADAVNYHELGDFFLAWYEKHIVRMFPGWFGESRAELAVKGEGKDFKKAMVEVYSNLTKNMPDNGMQMVMFTHQDPSVWADLGMILWAAGLKVTAAWTISTETAAGLKKGNYVQGTVCLVLRKRLSGGPGFLDEVYPLVEDEVKRQIASMQALDEDGEPNFNDADYQLAAYAAALKVLTTYSKLDGREVASEVFAERAEGQKSDFETVIERALVIACDALIPRGLDASWKDLSLVERYYLRALDIESRGERRQGMYEELARGFGVYEIKALLVSDKANGARMNTPTGFASTVLSGIDEIGHSSRARTGRAQIQHPFASTQLRHLLFSIRETASSELNPEPGRQYLRDTFGQRYWAIREKLVTLLDWLASIGSSEGMESWSRDSDAARILAGRLRNDHA